MSVKQITLADRMPELAKLLNVTLPAVNVPAVYEAVDEDSEDFPIKGSRVSVGTDDSGTYAVYFTAYHPGNMDTPPDVDVFDGPSFKDVREAATEIAILIARDRIEDAIVCFGEKELDDMMRDLPQPL
jgi:hypothetical protein